MLLRHLINVYLEGKRFKSKNVLIGTSDIDERTSHKKGEFKWCFVLYAGESFDCTARTYCTHTGNKLVFPD